MILLGLISEFEVVLYSISDYNRGKFLFCYFESREFNGLIQYVVHSVFRKGVNRKECIVPMGTDFGPKYRGRIYYRSRRTPTSFTF